VIELTQEQQKAYKEYIKHRDKVKVVLTNKNFMNEYVPFSEVLATIDVLGLNHPMYIQNDAWIDYLEAREGWLLVEPKERSQGRLRMSKGDYSDPDDWAEPVDKSIKEL